MASMASKKRMLRNEYATCDYITFADLVYLVLVYIWSCSRLHYMALHLIMLMKRCIITISLHNIWRSPEKKRISVTVPPIAQPPSNLRNIPAVSTFAHIGVAEDHSDGGSKYKFAQNRERKSSCAGFSWRRAIIWAKQPELPSRVADNGAALHYNARETMTLQCNVNASAQYKILTRSVHPRVGLLCGIKFRAKPRDSKVQSKCKSAPGDTLPMQIQMFLQDNPAEPSQSPPPSNVL